MQKDSAQAKISLKVVGGLLFLTHPVGQKPILQLHNGIGQRFNASCDNYLPVAFVHSRLSPAQVPRSFAL